MGGCYSYKETYVSPEEKKRRSVNSTLTDFFKFKDPALLIKAFRDHQSTGDSGFFLQVMKHQKISEAIDEFPGIEVESKLEIILEPGKGKEPLATEILDALEFPPTKSARYIKDACNNVSTGENSFFGSDGKEDFVVIQKGGGWYLKEKGPVEPYNLGIPGEQLVLRRAETRIPTDPLQLAQILTKKYSSGKTDYQGTITKTKSDAFLLNTLTGRMYGMTVTDAAVDDKRQMQLEFEYAGYIPGFNIDEGNEGGVVEDMVNIDKMVLLLYNPVVLKNGWKAFFRPTLETKYEFVSGNATALENGELLALPIPNLGSSLTKSRK